MSSLRISICHESLRERNQQGNVIVSIETVKYFLKKLPENYLAGN